jgi:hypothetical protein
MDSSIGYFGYGELGHNHPLSGPLAQRPDF